ncbi:alpha-L-fucosidase [Alloacidobacterium dinghuense]|uniref:alpha-L-fucosidase n=1 Tax=Alloacidobacterium dinghuense TaxID=2763107 RepID=A0A7G8BH68_9BACT|nr:alpha-L-fucosidase [Alloacidobacterium dinghuense]QNI31888.1 alpha-L-fucosidase [Alloacidobacterium dinghuense]
MSAQIWNRRQLLKTALAASSLPLVPNFAFAATEEDERTAWYRNAKFGMFIHWGPYSLASVEASWPIMRPTPGGISEADYRALPQRFSPTKFDPDAFVDLARTAGQEYMVFTTKHHDGFCMFDSSYTDYKITNAPYGKDIVKMLAEAADKRNMHLGFYYSPPDMHHPDFRDTSKLARDNWNGEPQRSEWPIYLNYMQLQLSELLTRYGPVALIWFDGLNHQEKYDGERFIKLIRSLQPATLVNDRIGVPGDYVTPEQFIPKAIPTKDVHFSAVDQNVQKELKAGIPKPEDFQLWETCMTINNTWAYNMHDHDYKSAQFLIRGLVEVASRGGNFLLNVGPQPDGVIQPEFQERLRAIGDWLAINGEAIYGTTYGPIQGNPAIRTTVKRETVFVHIFDWPASTLELKGFEPKVISAHMLATGQSLKFNQSEQKIEIEVPSTAPDPNATVVALRTL